MKVQYSRPHPIEATLEDAPAPSPRPSPFLPLHPVRRLDRADAAIGGLVFALAAALYIVTLTRGLNSMSGDSSELITKSALLEVAHSPGSPFYVWLGKLFTLLPVGQIATRVNLMSAVLGAVAIGFTYLICACFVAPSRLVAGGTAAIFALSLTFWSQAVIAELYAPNLAFLSATVFCLLQFGAAHAAAKRTQARRWLLCAGALYGLSLGIHLSNLMFVPVFALYLLLGWRAEYGNLRKSSLLASARMLDVRGGLVAFGLFMLCLLPYLWQGLNLNSFPYSEGRPAAAPGWPLFYEFTLNAYSVWRFAVPAASWPDRTFFILHMIARNFGWLVVPFIAYGIVTLLLRRTRLFYLFAGLALANFVFYGTYRVADIDVFFIPGFWALTPLLAYGLDRALSFLKTIAARTSVNLRAVSFWPLAVFVLVALAVQVHDNWKVNNRSVDVSLRDFYGNAFSRMPQGSYVYGRGASLGYDLLYYTHLYGVRPDLHVTAGPQEGETASPPFPPAPAYATTVKRDVFLPAFLSDPTGQSEKWYSPDLLGMFAWNGTIRRGWLTLFKLSPWDQPPADWLVQQGTAKANPKTTLHIPMAPNLTLLGFDVPAEARAGQAVHVVRYWRASSPDLPRIATVFGDTLAVEAHVPLFEQLPRYLTARNISPTALSGYVVRDEFDLVIPSSAGPGAYPLYLSTVANRVLTIVLDPTDDSELLPYRVKVGEIKLAQGQAPDPLATGVK